MNSLVRFLALALTSTLVATDTYSGNGAQMASTISAQSDAVKEAESRIRKLNEPKLKGISKISVSVAIWRGDLSQKEMDAYNSVFKSKIVRIAERAGFTIVPTNATILDDQKLSIFLGGQVDYISMLPDYIGIQVPKNILMGNWHLSGSRVVNLKEERFWAEVWDYEGVLSGIKYQNATFVDDEEFILDQIQNLFFDILNAN